MAAAPAGGCAVRAAWADARAALAGRYSATHLSRSFPPDVPRLLHCTSWDPSSEALDLALAAKVRAALPEFAAAAGTGRAFPPVQRCLAHVLWRVRDAPPEEGATVEAYYAAFRNALADLTSSHRAALYFLVHEFRLLEKENSASATALLPYRDAFFQCIEKTVLKHRLDPSPLTPTEMETMRFFHQWKLARKWTRAQIARTHLTPETLEDAPETLLLRKLYQRILFGLRTAGAVRMFGSAAPDWTRAIREFLRRQRQAATPAPPPQPAPAPPLNAAPWQMALPWVQRSSLPLSMYEDYVDVVRAKAELTVAKRQLAAIRKSEYEERRRQKTTLVH